MYLWDSSKTKKKAIEFASGWDNKVKPAYDDLLIPHQIKLDKAYSLELVRLEIISGKQYKIINHGLDILLKEYGKGKLSLADKKYEDVHSLVEGKLRGRYGKKIAGNIHIGLSRNDQIATLMRMWMRDQAVKTDKDLETLIETIKKEIRENGKSAFVGYSHYRIGMPTTYGELLDSYSVQLNRDKDSLENWIKQYNECPLGSGAGFGAELRVNRDVLAAELGFSRPTESSIDAVARWEAEVKLADAVKVMASHLSTIANDFIINSMEGINTIILPKEYCTGSSIMPQKYNPDVLEAIKAKAIDIKGEADKLSIIGGNDISGYTKSHQWTKYWIMNIFQEFDGSLEMMAEIIKGIKVNEKRAKYLLKKGGAYTAAEAIKLAVEKGIPYRTAKLRLERKLKSKSI